MGVLVLKTIRLSLARPVFVLLFMCWAIQPIIANAPDTSSFSDGLTIRHSPTPVVGQFSTDANIFKWLYRTEVINDLEVPIRVTRFAIYFKENEEWIMRNFSGQFFTSSEFMKWYTAGDSLADGWILPGKKAAIKGNWNSWGTYNPPEVKWVYIAEDSLGNKYRTEAIVALAPAPVPLLNGSIHYSTFYKYRAGDDTSWAKPALDDHDWIKRPNPSPYPDRERIGVRWCRMQVEIDSVLQGVPLGLLVRSRGALEFYIDGRLVHQYGRIGDKSHQEEAVTKVWYPRPRVISFSVLPGEVGERSSHIIAIRHSNYFLESPYWANAYADFSFELGDFEKMSQWREYVVRKAAFHQMFLTGVFLAFALIHSLLFFFYPRFKANAYFALLSAVACLIVYCNFQDRFFVDYAIEELWSVRLNNMGIALILLCLLRFTYEVNYERPPRFYPFFVVISIALIAWSWFRPFQPEIAIFFVFIFLAEIARTIIANHFQNSKLRLEGGGIILIGVLCVVLASIYQLLTFDLRIFPALWEYIEFPVIYYAFGLMMASISIFLSRNFAQTNKSLETKLVEVKALSELKLQQELERSRLERDNARKTQELEEARDLQLSMLPQQVPSLPNYEIAVYMKPATEVGGDYYDFKVADDGTLTAVIGDATGHGLQAGTMVVAAKGVFNSMSEEDNLVRLLQKSSAAIKAMGFRRLYMAMTIAKFNGDELQIASAGMPYAILYRSSNQRIEEIELKGMPLGSFPDFPYQQKQLVLHKQDTLLLLSDGLSEMFNRNKEEFGEERVKSIFSTCGGDSSDQIIDRLIEAGEKWASGLAQADDVTLLVIKRRE